MIVAVKPHVAKEVNGSRQISTGQYRIYIDGRAVGFVGCHHGAVPMLLERFKPSDLEQIQTAIAERLHPQTIKPIRQISEDRLEPIGESTVYDDFD